MPDPVTAPSRLPTFGEVYAALLQLRDAQTELQRFLTVPEPGRVATALKRIGIAAAHLNADTTI